MCGHTGPEEHDRRERQHHGRERGDEIDDAHQHGVEPAAVVPGEEAERDADDERDPCDREPDLDGGVQPVDRPAQDVAPDVIGAEQVVRPERRPAIQRLGAQVDRVPVVRRDLPLEERGADDREQDGERRNGDRPAREAARAPRASAGAASPQPHTRVEPTDRELGEERRHEHERAGQEQDELHGVRVDARPARGAG